MATEITVNETTLDVTVTVSNERGPIGPAGVVEAVEVGDITPVGAYKLIGRHTGTEGAAQEISVDGGLEFQGSQIRRAALTGDVTASAGSNATTIANDAVTNAKLANMAEATVKGRPFGAGPGDPQDLTAAQVQAIAVTAASIAAALPSATAAEEQSIRNSIQAARSFPQSRLFWTHNHILDQIRFSRGVILRTLTIGDSWALDCVDHLKNVWGDAGAFVHPIYSALVGGATSDFGTYNWNTTPGGITVTLDAAGEGVIFGGTPGSAGGPLGTGRFIAVAYEGGLTGTFQIQYEDTAGAWQNHGSPVDSSAVGAGFRVFETAVLPSTFATRVRVMWVSGTNRIYGAGLTHIAGNTNQPAGTQRQGVINARIDIGGTAIYNSEGATRGGLVNTPQAVWNNFLAWLKPDIIFVRESGEADASTWGPAMETIISRIRTAWPECDFVFIGRHPSNNEANASTIDEWARSWCETNYGTFVDVMAHMPNSLAEAKALEICRTTDDIHLRIPEGESFVRNIIWNALPTLHAARWQSTPNDFKSGGPRIFSDGFRGSNLTLYTDNSAGTANPAMRIINLGNNGDNGAIMWEVLAHGALAGNLTQALTYRAGTMPHMMVQGEFGYHSFWGPQTSFASRTPSSRVEIGASFGWQVPLSIHSHASQTQDVTRWVEGSTPSAVGTTRHRVDSGMVFQFDSTRVSFNSLPVHADNAAATAGGVPVGRPYRTATGQLMVRF